MPKATDKDITNRRSFLATGGTVTSAGSLTDPVYLAIDDHRTAAATYQALERLFDDAHAKLGENHNHVVNQLGLECDEAINWAQQATRDLVGTTPTTLPGILAMLEYLPNVEFLDGDLRTASASISDALRSLAPA
ncbi:hypothetical protein [Nitrobacter sp. TKz-YC02]|uniref:hypothetical protein n=1 Tax=Nitrobacter sp. TKz-YC02 TaxID=3398704 RepID=UPI003CF8D750